MARRPKVRAAQSTTAARTERAGRGGGNLLRKSNLEGIAAHAVSQARRKIFLCDPICQWPLIASHSIFSPPRGLMKSERYEKIIAR